MSWSGCLGLAAAALLLAGPAPKARARRALPAGPQVTAGSVGLPGAPLAARQALAAAGAAAVVWLVLGGTAAAALPAALAGAAAAAALMRSDRGRRLRDAAREGADVPLFLDVVATQLQAGAPVVLAVERSVPLAPPAARGPLGRAAALLRLGAAPAEAWSELAGTALADFGALATRSADSGSRLAEQARRLAADARSSRAAAAEAAARRAGVWAMAPLGLCFLPAFICLGVGPVVIGMIGEALGGDAGPPR